MALLDSPLKLGRKKWIAVVWATLECLFFGGLMYGWGTVSYVLKKEGIYSELCVYTTDEERNSTGLQDGENLNISRTILPEVTCEEQDKKMSLCFTVASSSSAIFISVFGYLNLKCGMRVTRVVILITSLLGLILMAFTSTSIPWLIFPGWSLLATGGMALLPSNLQVANVFTTGGPLIVGLICGAFDASSSFLLLLKVTVEQGFTRQNWFFVLAAMLSSVLFSTFIIMPTDHVQRPDEKDGMEIKVKNSSDGDTKKPVHKCDPEVTSVWNFLVQPMFLTHLVWMSIIQLRFWYFIGNINHYLNQFFNGDELSVSKYTNTFSYFLLGGFATAMLPGSVYEWQKRKFRDHELDVYRKLMPAVLPLLVSSLLSVCLSVLVLVQTEYLLYFTFGTVTVMRSFLYTSMPTFLYTVFPSIFSMFLYGVTMLITGGVFGSLQYALFEWTVATDNGSFQVDITLLVLTLTSCIHPLYLWVKCRRQARV